MRIYVSIIIIGLAFIGAILPERTTSRGELKPGEVLTIALSGEQYFTVDEVARLMVQEDTAYLMIDVRSSSDFQECHIPGAINLPLNDLLNPDWLGYLDQPAVKKIFYSNGNHFANEAWIVVEQKGFDNCYIMKGGLNEWFRTVMLTEFTGERISPAENFKFEMRYKARNHFNKMNSLPDSLKSAFLIIKRAKEAELVGGCE
jgi:rhodanese-related sulfurtransferase